MGSTIAGWLGNDPGSEKNSTHLACIFPALSDGYMPEYADGSGRMNLLNVELGGAGEAAGFQNISEAHKVAAEAAIAAAWALILTCYIGTDEISFYAFSNQGPTWNFSICSLKTHRSQTQLGVLRQAENFLYGPKSQETLLEANVKQDALGRISSRLVNTAIVFEKDPSHCVSDELDEVLKQVKLSVDFVFISKTNSSFRNTSSS